MSQTQHTGPYSGEQRGRDQLLALLRCFLSTIAIRCTLLSKDAAKSGRPQSVLLNSVIRPFFGYA